MTCATAMPGNKSAQHLVKVCVMPDEAAVWILSSFHSLCCARNQENTGKDISPKCVGSDEIPTDFGKGWIRLQSRVVFWKTIGLRKVIDLHYLQYWPKKG